MLPIKKTFNIETSIGRINAIIDPDKSVLEVDSSYPQNLLDYNTIVKSNLIYISVCLRADNSQEREDNLFKLYKACLSELIPIMAESNSLLDIDEMEFLNVIGIYSYDKNENINFIIDIVAKINSMCEVLNRLFEKKNMTRLIPGIGVSIAETHIMRMTEAEPKTEEILRISNGIGMAMNFAGFANTGLIKNPIIIGSNVWEQLTEKYKQFFSHNEAEGYYYASLVNISINNWLKENR